jgi:hypothetical protein
MQIQPKSDATRLGRVQRARQAARLNEDAFKGGDRPQGRLKLKSPWKLGNERLWESLRDSSREE